MRDHRGNGKIERLIRTINERLRINKNIILKKDNSGLSGILYILRIGKKADGTSPFEKSHGGEPNTVKSNIVNEWLRKPKGVLEEDSKATFAASDFEERIVGKQRVVVEKEKILTRAKDSILKVENEKCSKAPSGNEKHDTRQPIKSPYGRAENNATEISGAYNPVKSQANNLCMSAAIDKINEAFLPANFEADKQSQKIIKILKTQEGGKHSRLP